MTESAIAATSAPEEVYEDLWGVEETTNVFLDAAKKQYVVIKKMNEGDKSRFQKLTNRDMTVNRDQEAKISMDPAADRHSLIAASVVDWKLFQKDPSDGKFYPAPYGKKSLMTWMESANPVVIEKIEREIREYNPWLLDELTIEGIDDQIEKLYDTRKKLVEKESGEASSANK